MVQARNGLDFRVKALFFSRCRSTLVLLPALCLDFNTWKTGSSPSAEARLAPPGRSLLSYRPTPRRDSRFEAIQSRCLTRRSNVYVSSSHAPGLKLKPPMDATCSSSVRAVQWFLVVRSMTHACNALSCSAFSWQVW